MVISPKRILWPTDFSELALHGGRYSRGYCDVFGAELHIIHVMPPPLSPDVTLTLPGEVPISLSEPELLNATRASLKRLVDEEFGGDSKVATHALIGNPWSKICDYAKRNRIDLIILTTHGRTGFQRVLIGSTAERVVQHASCPVLVIKDPERDFLIE